eukprot:SAG22_NODE_11153_length_498_cov_0.807018_1_plen_118_part_01
MQRTNIVHDVECVVAAPSPACPKPHPVLVSAPGPLAPFLPAGQLNPFNAVLEKHDWLGRNANTTAANAAAAAAAAAVAAAGPGASPGVAAAPLSAPAPVAGHIRGQNSDVIEVQTLGE